MELKNKKLEVNAIKNGTVIDHIPANALFKVIELLGLDDLESNTVQMTFATNLSSNRIGKKAMVKIVDTYCSDVEMSYLALVAPKARVSIIKDYAVVEKRDILPPTEVKRFVKCANPMCITNHEKIGTKFTVSMEGGDLSLKCRYCEKTTLQEQIEILRKN